MASPQYYDASSSGSKVPDVTVQQPPPPPQYPAGTAVPMTQQPQPGQPTVMVTAPVKYQEVPVRTRCQFCSTEMSTNVSFKNGMLTWLAAGGICFLGAPFGLFLGCCLIPFCIDSLKDVEHTCSSCGQVVGVYKRLS